MRKMHRTNINTECLTSQSSFYEAVFTFRNKRFHYKGLAVICKDQEHFSDVSYRIVDGREIW